MENKKNVTMKHVASKAGVTIGTVSNVINKTAPVSEPTKKKVLEVIQELNYIPNPMAQYMRSKKSRIIGMLVPNITNYFYSNTIRVFIDEAESEGYSVLILGYNYSLANEKQAIESLLKYNVEVIIIANGYDDEEYIKLIQDKNVPVILVDRYNSMDNVHCLMFDNRKVIYDVISILKDKGYETIGFVSEPLKLNNLSERYNSYVDAMQKYNLTFNQEHVYISETLRMDNVKNSYTYMSEIMNTHSKEELPSAFIFSSDLSAIGGISAIQEFGYTVPGDFGVVGCDNIDVAGYLSPRLTTINQDQKMLAKELWKMTRACAKGEKVNNITLEQQLIMRESC